MVFFSSNSPFVVGSGKKRNPDKFSDPSIVSYEFEKSGVIASLFKVLVKPGSILFKRIGICSNR